MAHGVAHVHAGARMCVCAPTNMPTNRDKETRRVSSASSFVGGSQLAVASPRVGSAGPEAAMDTASSHVTEPHLYPCCLILYFFASRSKFSLYRQLNSHFAFIARVCKDNLTLCTDATPSV